MAEQLDRLGAPAGQPPQHSLAALVVQLADTLDARQLALVRLVAAGTKAVAQAAVPVAASLAEVLADSLALARLELIVALADAARWADAP